MEKLLCKNKIVFIIKQFDFIKLICYNNVIMELYANKCKLTEGSQYEAR